MAELDKPTFDTKAFRNACGRFATGITVVTTEVDGAVHGMTANGFMSVSLDPPLVVISVAKKAHLHSLIAQSGTYAVSILSHKQEPYSVHFAGWSKAGFEPVFDQRNGYPVIANAIAYFVTKLYAVYEGGDHTLYLGQVDYFESNEPDPLLYYGGKYRWLRSVDS